MSSQLSCVSSTIHSLDQMNLTKTRFLPYQWRSYHSMKNKVRFNNSYTSCLFTNKHLLYLQKSTTTTRMHSSRMRTARSSSRRGGSPSGNPPGADLPVDIILDTHLWKYYLTPNSFAGGNKPINNTGSCGNILYWLVWQPKYQLLYIISFCPHSSTSFEFAYTVLFSLQCNWLLVVFNAFQASCRTVRNYFRFKRPFANDSGLKHRHGICLPSGTQRIQYIKRRQIDQFQKWKVMLVMYVCYPSLQETMTHDNCGSILRCPQV